MGNDRLVDIKITLDGTDPAIWRLIRLDPYFTLNEVHHIIQIAMGWKNTHLYSFNIEDIEYTLPDYRNEVIRYADSNKYRLSDFLEYEFKYLYDFGDHWMHTVSIFNTGIEDVITHPFCFEGEGACPPEDVGGMSGFKDFKESMDSPNHPDRESNIIWYGKEFDPYELNLRYINYQYKELDEYIESVD